MTFKENTLLITSTDPDLFDDLANLPDGVTISPVAACSIDFAAIGMHLVNFSGELAIAAFTVWLTKRLENKSTGETCIKGLKVTDDFDQISAAINIALKEYEEINTYNKQQHTANFPDQSLLDTESEN